MGHQEAKKLTHTAFPAPTGLAKTWPSKVSARISGAGEPERFSDVLVTRAACAGSDTHALRSIPMVTLALQLMVLLPVRAPRRRSRAGSAFYSSFSATVLSSSPLARVSF